MARITKAPEERKREIIETAKELFIRQSYEKTQMGDISKAIGVAHGLVYHYFRSKAEILDIVIDELYEEDLNKFLEIINDERLDPIEKLNVIFSDYWEQSVKLCSMAASMGIEENIESFERISKRKIDILLPQFERMIIQGKESGHFDCPYPKQAACFCIYGEMALEMHHSGSMDELHASVKEMFWRVLGINTHGVNTRGVKKSIRVKKKITVYVKNI
jgi:AcrR family transcriptional regulator